MTADSPLPAQPSGLVCPRHEEVSAELCAEGGCRDARLMLAAPDLLEALSLMVECFGPGVDYYGDGAGPGEIDSVRMARAAIAKATAPQQDTEAK